MTMNVHFVGIGGIHMSGLAHMLLDDGLFVSGCDLADTPVLQALRERGAPITIGHNERHVETATQVVRTAAVAETHAEIARALELRIPVKTRAELLAEIAAARQVIAVGGTHGKTTTTAMIAHAMRAAGRDCGYAIGGEALDFDVHARRGSDDWFVLEADEYGRAFHHYSPAVAILNNCEPDHLDYYGSQDALEEAFFGYLRTIKQDGTLIVGIDSPIAVELADRVRADRPDVRVVTASSRSNADFMIESCGEHVRIRTPRGTWCGSLRQPGEYQRQNAAVALAALDAAGFDLDQSIKALRCFRGVNRRFQLHGEAAGVVLLDDYAHHPTEVSAAIAAARQRWPERRIVVLFQPHTFTRTSYLIDGFRTCFADADVVYTVDTYAARDMQGAELSSEQMAAEIVAPSATYGGAISDCAEIVAASVREGDLVITMGAGDIGGAGPIILDQLRARADRQ